MNILQLSAEGMVEVQQDWLTATLATTKEGRDAAVVAEGLLAKGVIIKPWKEPGFTQFLRVSVGLQEDNQRFVQALSAVLGRPI